MIWITKLNTLFAPRELSRARIVAAITAAVVADVLQIALLPVAWTFVQEAIDVVAMGLTMVFLGFHLLLLPTFAVELFPLVDALPTWTACVVAVIALRKQKQKVAQGIGAPPMLDAPPQKPPAQIGGGAPDQGTLPR